MRSPTTSRCVTAVMLMVLAGSSAHGGVIEFLDKEDWIGAVGNFTTIDFTGFPEGQFITEQYADLGVHFDGTDTFFFTQSFVNDNWGVDGNGDSAIIFDKPQAYIAVDHPGFLRIDLYSEGRLFYQSSWMGGDATGNFKGVISSQLFDEVRFVDPVGEVFYDDVFFGVPTPAGLYVMTIAALARRRRRR